MANLPPAADRRPPLHFHYRNHRGELATRHVHPIMVWFGSTEWHKEPQWLLKAYDLERKADRDFALTDVAFGDPKRIPRFNPNQRRPYAVAVLGIIIVVLVLVGALTIIKTYAPVVRSEPTSQP